MTEEEERKLMENPDSKDELPVLDIGDYLAGKPGARERIGKQLREISETVGFFYLAGHGIPQAQIDRIFAENRRIHKSPLEKLRTIRKASRRRPGYDAMEDKKHLGGVAPPTLNSAFSMQRERSPEDPKLKLDDEFYQANKWPDWLPGFREEVVGWYSAMEALGKKMMPLWAAAMDLPADYFDGFFNEPYISMTMTYYPHQKVIGNNQYGIQPHTDNTVMTILAQYDVPGLAVQMPDGHWRIADVKPGTLLINSGNTMVRLSNGRFKSTKHVVINTDGRDRYSVPLFFGMDQEALIECAPTCVSADNPAQFEPMTYRQLMEWYLLKKGNFAKSAGPDVKGGGYWVAVDTTPGNAPAESDYG